MCIALPGRIVKIEKDIATIDYNDHQKKAKLVENGYNVGDYVIVQSGVILQRISEEEAKEALALIR